VRRDVSVRPRPSVEIELPASFACVIDLSLPLLASARRKIAAPAGVRPLALPAARAVKSRKVWPLDSLTSPLHANRPVDVLERLRLRLGATGCFLASGWLPPTLLLSSSPQKSCADILADCSLAPEEEEEAASSSLAGVLVDAAMSRAVASQRDSPSSSSSSFCSG